MKVRPCEMCPYTPDDLGDLYDERAQELVCANCPTRGMIRCLAFYPKDNHYARKGNGPRFPR